MIEVETIRTAVARMRALADAATPGRWVRYSTDFRDQRSHSTKGSAGSVVAFEGYGPDGGSAYANAEFIAAADPLFVRAVADMLEAAADNDDDDPCLATTAADCYVRTCPTHRAFAVARTFLGDTDE